MQTLKRLLSLLFFLLLVLLGMWVAQDNAASVPLRLLGFDVATLPLGLLLLAGFFAGALLGVLSASLLILRLRAQLRRCRRSQIQANKAAGVEASRLRDRPGVG